ncbi:peptide ABC transporter substrate-binding protein [Romboutsia sp.]|uniref:ABC transporter substrate-binding protein n=1 Tax=Romboutsia sp. TaxID=1965302 RepID=UPI002BC4511D|nr:peptide ABC transporter substrate-binding protein [Romboutsia sp.]HSQ89216.1 peptide ABC transporter substrate-binding protein [Romboutsia sp.]
MKKLKILSIILAISIMVVGCSDKIESGQKKDTDKSSMNLEYINLTMVKPTTINPILNKDKSVGYITNLIYDGLFTIDENYNVVPQLVKEYGISQDGMSIDIKLKNAKWHDGTTVTSQDVKFSVDLIQKNTDSPYNVLTQNIASISIANNSEFTINFKEKYAFSVDTLIFPIVSQSKLGSVSDKDIKDYKKNLIGNGPYKIEKYEERDGMILTRNEEYYNELPNTTKDIKVGIVPDEEAQVSMVMALDSDIAGVSLNDLSKFYEKEFNITKYEGRDYESLIFNYNNPFLRDVNFRKAIAHAINREKIAEEGYMGDAKLINFPLNSNSKYYNKDVKVVDYNKDKSKEYLDKVKPITDEQIQNLINKDNANKSYKEAEKNKTDIKDNDQKNSEENIKKMITKLNLKIIVNKNNTERVKSAHMIGEYLKTIGIKSTIEELEDKDIEDAINSKDYDLALVGWELSIVPDVRSIIESSGYNDEKLNNYMESLSSATSQSQVEDIYKSIQKYINDNVIFMSLVIRDDYMVTNRRVQGEISPNDFDVYEGIINLTIKDK